MIVLSRNLHSVLAGLFQPTRFDETRGYSPCLEHPISSRGLVAAPWQDDPGSIWLDGRRMFSCRNWQKLSGDCDESHSVAVVCISFSNAGSPLEAIASWLFTVDETCQNRSNISGSQCRSSCMNIGCASHEKRQSIREIKFPFRFTAGRGNPSARPVPILS